MQSHVELPIITPDTPSTLSSAVVRRSGSGLLLSTSSDVVQASAMDLRSRSSRKWSTCLDLLELASTSRNRGT